MPFYQLSHALENCRSVCKIPFNEDLADHANSRNVKYDERIGAEYNISTSYIISCVHDNISFEMVVEINSNEGYSINRSDWMRRYVNHAPKKCICESVFTGVYVCVCSGDDTHCQWPKHIIELLPERRYPIAPELGLPCTNIDVCIKSFIKTKLFNVSLDGIMYSYGLIGAPL